MTRRAVIGGCALGFATGWNIANTGAIASRLADTYGVRLAVIGLFTTMLFVTHLAMQIPAGRASDRFGPRRVGVVAITLLLAFNLLALIAPDPTLALVARLLIGIGTGLGFISGSAYVRAQSGSAFAQGLFGGFALSGAGVGLAVVPVVVTLGTVGSRAPFATAIVVPFVALAFLLAGPADEPRQAVAREEHLPSGVIRDVRLYKLAVLFSCSLGLSVVVGNWTTTLLQRAGGMSLGAAGAIAALTLALGVVSRPLGGWILQTRPARVRVIVASCLVAGAVGCFAVAAARPAALVALGAMLIGIAAGIPFAPAFQGAARLRPDAQAAAVGFVNGAASIVILVGTPLVGLAFSLPGHGRTGFVVVGVLWALALFLLPSSYALTGEIARAAESRSG